MKRSERLAGRLRKAVLAYQRRLADYLNLQTLYWNKASKLVLLALVVLLFGGFSLYELICLFI